MILLHMGSQRSFQSLCHTSILVDSQTFLMIPEGRSNQVCMIDSQKEQMSLCLDCIYRLGMDIVLYGEIQTMLCYLQDSSDQLRILEPLWQCRQ